jgi:hypothetical protein
VEKPSDFDWVTARMRCSTANVFEALHLTARQNVEARGAGTENPFSLVEAGGGFSVLRHAFAGKVGVRFSASAHEIAAESFGGGLKVSLKARLTLNDDGDCRLLVDGEELQEWQFLKRALEPLLFGPTEW